MVRRPIRRLWLRTWHGTRRKRARRPFNHFRMASAILGVGLALLTIYLIDSQIRPIICGMAEANAKNVVTVVINQAVNETLANESVAYDDIVVLQKDVSGRISAMTTSSPKMNALRTKILENIVEQVKTLDVDELGIPVGNLTGFVTASGLGPLVPVRIFSVASPEAGFRNVFQSAGVNQTLHQVMLDVTVSVSLLIPGATVETEISTQVCVAETVIVGEVPNAYLQFPISTP